MTRKNKSPKLLLLVFVFCNLINFVFACVGLAAGKSSPKVLDFEADLIEGERKAPNVFIDMEINRPTLDLVLYQRNNFNDFHMAEKNRRPRYFAPVVVSKTKKDQSKSLAPVKKSK